MSPRLRRLSARDLVAALGRLGFHVVATRGSHAKLRRVTPDGARQTLTIPLHRDLAPGTLHAIFRQASKFIPSDEPAYPLMRTPAVARNRLEAAPSPSRKRSHHAT